MSPSSPSTPKSRKGRGGVFQNQQWLCDCDPRLTAAVRTVASNPSLFGKRFYSCPNYGSKGKHCNMFLLVEDAKEREQDCLMSNSRSEKRQTTLLESMTPSKPKPKWETPSSTAQTSTLKNYECTSSQQDDLLYDQTSGDEEIISTITTKPSTPQIQSKRKRSSETVDLLDDLSSGGEEELVAVTESTSKKTSTLDKQRDTFATPSATRTTNITQNGLPTPSSGKKGTSVKKTLFQDKFQNNNTNEVNHTNDVTPNPKRQRLEKGSITQTSDAFRLFGTDETIDIKPVSPLPPPLLSSIDLTSEVMRLLKRETIAPAVRKEVRNLLDKYMTLARGHERGWHASRQAANEAETWAAIMKKKVDDLMLSRMSLRTQLMELYEDI